MSLPWVYDDGGRAAAGFTGFAGDCATRAIATATLALLGGDPGDTYRAVYDGLWETVRASHRRKDRTRSPRDGVTTTVLRKYLTQHGWAWHPTMSIGSGCKVHLRRGELPIGGVSIVNVSKHLTVVVDGIVHDTEDPGRDGTRCVYGYWTKPAPLNLASQAFTCAYSRARGAQLDGDQ